MIFIFIIIYIKYIVPFNNANKKKIYRKITLEFPIYKNLYSDFLSQGTRYSFKFDFQSTQCRLYEKCFYHYCSIVHAQK